MAKRKKLKNRAKRIMAVNTRIRDTNVNYKKLFLYFKLIMGALENLSKKERDTLIKCFCALYL